MSVGKFVAQVPSEMATATFKFLYNYCKICTDFKTVRRVILKQSLQHEQNDLHTYDYLLMKFKNSTFFGVIY
jgi:hypothetical protein